MGYNYLELEDRLQNIVENLNESEFIYEFLSLYGLPKATISKLKQGTSNLSSLENVKHLKNKIYFAVSSHGKTLETFASVAEELGANDSTRFIFATDFKNINAKDTKTGDTLDINFADLPKHFDFFLPLMGVEKVEYDKENPLDQKAASRFLRVYDELAVANKNIDPKVLNLFLIRLLFCLFAEDTGIFEKDSFTSDVKRLAQAAGSDLNAPIAQIFEKLSRKENKGDSAWLQKYPYVNGNLFTSPHERLNFTPKAKKLIIEAGSMLNWSQINPDILGSMIQTASSKSLRQNLGMHYTSVENIMKVIRPLFLDKLKNELREILSSSYKNETKISKLKQLLSRIGKMKFFDPACGSGNFLIIAYKEMRRLEIEIYEEIIRLDQQIMLFDPIVQLSQFYGIEIDDFAHEVAMLSLWISDHQMNTELNGKIPNFIRKTLPLQKIGGIICANALRVDWNEICPKNKDDEVFVFGNPPYLGAARQNDEQKRDLDFVFKNLEGYRKLDYISAWFYLGARYIEDSNSLLAFVSTNSITQGEQVAYLWRPILNFAEISFAYTSFKWQNNAAHNAGVTVIIVGLKSLQAEFDKTIFTGNDKISAQNINPYLADTGNVIVKGLNFSLNEDFLPMVKGCSPTDGGGLILDAQEYNEIISKYPEIEQILKRYIGSEEFINSTRRYCIWLDDDKLETYRKYDFLQKRFDVVRNSRLQSQASSTVEYANAPHLFKVRGERDEAFKKFKSNPQNQDEEMLSIIIPSHSSENRLYVPMGVFSDDEIVSNAAMVIYDAPIWLLGVLSSRMHMVWLRAIGGRLKTDYRYSASLVYNTFVVPEISEQMKVNLEEQMGEILDKRDFLGGSLASLYGSPLAENNPKPMNEELLNLHKRLDRLVDSIYQRAEFKNDEERLALLLNLYKKRIEELENE
ncbi:class I SAM-dependent DNA methyltransferase [Campylobacter concisus]|uniref:class I SAM-dependent DNA methyltransferase n=1 Tax=Campylobacter concisus TaxID=199 RepID=UPI00122CD9B1|nr:DNA methyltransferase [Campylobacter concisus]